jgi:hypothetical protein
MEENLRIPKRVAWLCVLLFTSLLATAQSPPSSEQADRQTVAGHGDGDRTAADDAEKHPRQQIVAKETVPIRFSPPRPWLLGFPGWEVARTEVSEHYSLLRRLEIDVFSSTHAWAEVELSGVAGTGPKSGWVYWGESFTADSEHFNWEDTALPPADSSSSPTQEGRP